MYFYGPEMNVVRLREIPTEFDVIAYLDTGQGNDRYK